MRGRLPTVTAIFTTYWPTMSGHTGNVPRKARVTKRAESTAVEQALETKTRSQRYPPIFARHHAKTSASRREATR